MWVCVDDGSFAHTHAHFCVALPLIRYSCLVSWKSLWNSCAQLLLLLHGIDLFDWKTCLPDCVAKFSLLFLFSDWIQMKSSLLKVCVCVCAKFAILYLILKLMVFSCCAFYWNSIFFSSLCFCKTEWFNRSSEKWMEAGVAHCVEQWSHLVQMLYDICVQYISQWYTIDVIIAASAWKLPIHCDDTKSRAMHKTPDIVMFISDVASIIDRAANTPCCPKIMWPMNIWRTSKRKIQTIQRKNNTENPKSTWIAVHLQIRSGQMIQKMCPMSMVFNILLATIVYESLDVKMTVSKCASV